MQDDSPLARALAQRDAGDFDGAIDTLFRAASLSLGDVEVSLTLAKMLAETGQVERAEPWFKHALKLAPDDLQVRMGYGTLLGQTGRLAEAREVLAKVMADLMETLEVAEATEDRDALIELEGFIGATAINLARTALETGETGMARDLVAPWLADPDHWTFAHNVLADVIERTDLDPLTLAEEGLASGRVSPYMVCFLIEQALDVEPVDFDTIDRVIARANAVFAFDWQTAAPEIEAALATARQLFGRATMRGQVDATGLTHVMEPWAPTPG